MGFNTPIYRWIIEDFNNFTELQLQSIESLKISFLNGKKILSFWNDYKKGKVYYQNLLWRILIFVLCYKKYILNIK